MFDWLYMGNRIRIVRVQRKMTQSCLAARLKISVNRLRSIEYGRTRIQVDQLAELAEVLDVSMDYLATGKLKSSPGMIPITLNLDDVQKPLIWYLLRGRKKQLRRAPFSAQRMVRRKACHVSVIPRMYEEDPVW